jgi:cytosine/adenosine deaminase-related metal-dependent hydrolase
MTDLLLTNGTVVAMNADRDILSDGAVAVADGEIVDVGPTDRIEAEYTAPERIDASGQAILPGFISTHVHVSGILLRGLGNHRNLYDWLINVKRPGTSAMTAEDHTIAAAVYAREALSTGLTTFVENATGSGGGYDTELLEGKFAVYDAAGVRNIYAYAFADKPPSQSFVESAGDIAMREPSVAHVLPDETVADTQDALDTVESLIESYHGTADGRQSVWPAPYLATIVTPEGLQGAYDIAERHDVMTTTHTAEDAFNEQSRRLSSVAYLRNAGYLGERALLGHCVQVSEADMRALAVTDTRVAHNTLANCALGSGIAPVPTMQSYGVTVAMGTDNVPNNDTVNMFKDMEVAAHLHKAHNRDAGAITAEKVLEMATIDAAHAIGRGDDLGSIESGKLADMVLVDLDCPHMTPSQYLPATLVYQTRGSEVDTVICNGEVVYEDGRVPGVAQLYDDLDQTAADAAADIIDRAGMGPQRDRTWTSIND